MCSLDLISHVFAFWSILVVWSMVWMRSSSTPKGQIKVDIKSKTHFPRSESIEFHLPLALASQLCIYTQSLFNHIPFKHSCSRQKAWTPSLTRPGVVIATTKTQPQTRVVCSTLHAPHGSTHYSTAIDVGMLASFAEFSWPPPPHSARKNSLRAGFKHGNRRAIAAIHYLYSHADIL